MSYQQEILGSTFLARSAQLQGFTNRTDSRQWHLHYDFPDQLRQKSVQLTGTSRVCTVVQYAVLEAIRTVYGIWQI